MIPQNSKPSFSLGLSYWPRRRSRAEQILCSWADCDLGALRADMAQIAGLGFNSVHLEPRWAELSLSPSRANTVALSALERALDLAHDQRLQVTIGILSGSLGGALHLPAWAVGFRLPSDALRAARLGPPLIVPGDYPPILSDDRYRREPARDIYSDPDMRTAVQRLIHETVGNLAGHPAIAGWQLGAQIGRTRRPASARAIGEWWRDLAEQARSHGARQIFGVIDAFALNRSDMLRPEQIYAAGGTVVVSAAPFPPLQPARPWAAGRVGFLHALVAGLLHAEARRAVPVIVADIGAPMAAAGASGTMRGEIFGQAVDTTLADADQQAQLVEQALAELWHAGAAGAWLAAYADHAPSLWSIPPLDRDWTARTWGIVEPDGAEKPAAIAAHRFATQLRDADPATRGEAPALPIDPERYWRDPAAAFRSLLGEWRAKDEG